MRNTSTLWSLLIHCRGKDSNVLAEEEWQSICWCWGALSRLRLQKFLCLPLTPKGVWSCEPGAELWKCISKILMILIQRNTGTENKKKDYNKVIGKMTGYKAVWFGNWLLLNWLFSPVLVTVSDVHLPLYFTSGPNWAQSQECAQAWKGEFD